MASYEFKNNARSTVADNPLAQAAVTLNVATGEGANFPSSFPFKISLWDATTYPNPGDDSGMEIVKCTGRSTDVLTIVRAQESTADVAHSLGERVAMLATAGHFTDIITKLDTIETNADVTDTANVTSAGAFMDSEFPDQSFTNLLKNGDFESWSAGAAAAPDGYSFSGGGASIDRENTIKKINNYSAKITRSGANTMITQNIYDVHYRGRVVTAGVWVYSATASIAIIIIQDGVGNTASSFHTGNSTWQFLTVTRTIDASATQTTAICGIYNSDGIAYFDGVILVEGSVCPAFSPHPTDQIPIVLTSAPTDAGTNGETRWYAIAGASGARRLYMSNGTDWKYIAIST